MQPPHPINKSLVLTSELALKFLFFHIEFVCIIRGYNLFMEGDPGIVDSEAIATSLHALVPTRPARGFLFEYVW